MIKRYLFIIFVITIFLLYHQGWAQVISENPSMDMQVRVENLTFSGNTGEFDLVFEVRTTDGASRLIAQMQNDAQFDENFAAAVTDAQVVEWVFPSNAYNQIWRWTQVDGVIEFQTAFFEGSTPVAVGGPTVNDWWLVLKVHFVFDQVPGATGTIVWADVTPHFNVRAAKLSGGGTETIHKDELGTPIQIPLSDQPPEKDVMDMRMRIDNIIYTINEGTFDFYVDISTTDGSGRSIETLQNAILFVDRFQGLIKSVQLKSCNFPDTDYLRDWHWDKDDGTVEFSFTHNSGSPYMDFGGPQPGDWTTVVVFEIKFRQFASDTGDIDWLPGSFFIEALKVGQTGVETIHHEQMGHLAEVRLYLLPTSENPLMDMRIRTENLQCVGNSASIDLWFDVRTTDGSVRGIYQLQNSAVVDEVFRQQIISVTPSYWAFPETDYVLHWRYTAPAGVLEFQAAVKEFSPYVQLGGPDGETWSPFAGFTIEFNQLAGQSGEIYWWYDTPHISIRALKIPPPGTELIHGFELGAPVVMNLYCDGVDSDGDGILDDLDDDDDNDGLLDVIEGDEDTDGDGVPNRLDIDSDNDGICDIDEGQPSLLKSANGVEKSSIQMLGAVDTDNDGTPDFLDPDSDQDSVPDDIEGHDSNKDGQPDTTPTGSDNDGDGMDDGYDTVPGPDPVYNAAGSNAPMQNSDATDLPDWRDPDDDNDGVATIDDSHADLNQNGIVDYLDPEVIPVELTTFKAIPQNNGVRLEWVTQSETNNMGFFIYRSDSKNGNYININSYIISGAGNSAVEKTYSFMDHNIEANKTYFYKLADVSYDGQIKMHGPVEATALVPVGYALEQNYPNPFNPETSICYTLRDEGFCTLTVFNLQGQKVRTLISEHRTAGAHTVVWDGSNESGKIVPSGVYLYKLEVNGHNKTKKMEFIK
ncbi:T9SS type A sorting domain-containing protein [candidate division KSB1 bacterium]|nr:T9SS type A sorting domain-containing protein [candidate division KSB1 bacterium]